MEDQGKRLLLAVGIALVLMMAWQMLFPPEKPPPEDDKTEDAPAETTKPKSGDGDKAGDKAGDKPGTAKVAEVPDGAEPPAVARGDEQLETFTFDRFKVTFSSYGGAVRSWVLLDEQFEDRTATPHKLLELVPTPAETANYMPLTIAFKESKLTIADNAEWTGERTGDTAITYTYEDDKLKVQKFFELVPNDFLVKLRIDVFKKTNEAAKQSLVIHTFQAQDPAGEKTGGMTRLPRFWRAVCRVDGENESIKSSKLAENGEKAWAGNIDYAGFDHSYFFAAISPKSDADNLRCEASAIEGVVGGMRMALSFPPVSMAEGESAFRRDVVAYFGPKFHGLLGATGKEAGYDTKFEESINFGWFGILSVPLLWLLILLQGVVVSWGVAIVLLTFIVKLATLPWTHKSMKSMKAMSKLQPQMKKIREKYKDDKQRQQVETMNLFKTHGVNPLAGCLPMILQMPIWFALYRMLMAVAELYQAPFLWITDLTAPDPYYILPIAVSIMMFFQTRMTPTTASGTQQKIIMYGLPLMFGVFAFFFPAGLALYMFSNACLTITHHFFIHREDRVAAKAKKKREAERKARGEPPEPEEDEDDDPDDSEAEAASAKSKGGSGKKGKKGSGKKGQNQKSGKKGKKGAGKKGKGSGKKRKSP